jgi:hypothetical protein
MDGAFLFLFSAFFFFLLLFSLTERIDSHAEDDLAYLLGMNPRREAEGVPGNAEAGAGEEATRAGDAPA